MEPTNIDSLKTILVFLATSFTNVFRAYSDDNKVDASEGFQVGLQVASGVMPVIEAAKDVPQEWKDGAFSDAEMAELEAAVAAALPSELKPSAKNITAQALLVALESGNLAFLINDLLAEIKEAKLTDPA